MDPKDLVPGDHFKMYYGFDQTLFYVLTNYGEYIDIGGDCYFLLRI